MSRGPKNFEEAIDSLAQEAAPEVEAGKDAARDALGHLESEFRKIWSSLQSLSGEGVRTNADRAKASVEEQFKQNPWITIGVVGLVCLVIGFLLGGRRSE